jgi:2-methylcitrate dehydratase
VAAPQTDLSPDPELAAIADYVLDGDIRSDAAYATAHLALFDFLGCALAGLDEEDCRRIIRPIVPGAETPGGARIPGTRYQFDPATAAFAMGCMGRWLDFNDSWFGTGGGHPADMLGGLLGTADWMSRRARAEGEAPVVMATVATLAIKAYEILGLHLLENDFGRYDYSAPLKAATAATVCALLGGGRREIVAALSQGWVDGQPLRIFRTPYTGPRKNWGSPDAAARGVWHAFKAVDGEPGYPRVLTTPEWGTYDVEQRGKPFHNPLPYGSHVMERIQFKVYPAQFRAQTAMEAAIRLHPQVAPRLGEVARVEIHTHARTLKTIDKPGPLALPSERDHSLQYITAIGLIFGDLEYRHYHDAVAQDPRINRLIAAMTVAERPAYTAGYDDRARRTDANAIRVHFAGGGATEEVEILYPMGDAKRRAEAIPVLARKFRRNIAGRLPAQQEAALLRLYDDPAALAAMAVDDFMALTVAAG